MKSSSLKKNKKVIVITGAAGQVSYSLLFLLTKSDFFNEDDRLHLILIDDPKFLKKLDGIRLELIDSVSSKISSIKISSDMNFAFKNADWIIFNGGFHQKPRMTKKTFIKLNGELIAKQAQALNKHIQKPKTVKILMVANPVNINCNILSYFAPKIPKKNIFGLSFLDHNRTLSALSTKLKVQPEQICNSFAWGNHSSTVYPSIEHCRVRNQFLKITPALALWHTASLVPLVQGRGENIINLRGHNSAGSAAIAIIDAMRMIEGKVSSAKNFSMICCSNGEYNIKKNIWFSFPCCYKKNSVKVIDNLSISSYSQIMISLSEKEILTDLEIAKDFSLWSW